MQFSPAIAVAILAAIPAALGCSGHSSSTTTFVYGQSTTSTLGYGQSATPTQTSISSVSSSSSGSSSGSSTTSSSPASTTTPGTSTTTGSTTSYDMNESTSACPVATNLPSCATACIHAAAIVIGCAQQEDMHHCQCVHFDDLSDEAAPCIIDSCGTDKAMEAKSVGQAICSACEGVYA